MAPIWPHSCSHATPEGTENAILALRSKYPSWGARNLKARLERLEPGVDWPAASTFGNILQRAGLTSPKRKKRRTTPYSDPFSEVTAANQLWCMDFKGYFNIVDGMGCDPFTITDAHSRYLIRCQIVARMDLSQVRAVCEAAMREYGMPARIRTDNGAPFAGTGLLGLSKLSLGWIKMGIVHERIQPGRPQQNGRCERRYRAPLRELPRSQGLGVRFPREKVIRNANHPGLQWNICVQGRQGWRFRLRDSIHLIVTLSDPAVKPYPIPLSTLIPKNLLPE
jgi:transposase InsO family protein